MVLAAYFGDDTPFSATSDAAPGVVRRWNRFSDSALELNDARVYFGIHFRSAVVDGRAAGEAVAEYVLAHVTERAHPRRSGQTKHDHGVREMTPDGQITAGDGGE